VKPLDLLDAASAQLLRFDWLVDAVAPVSPYGRRRFDELRPFRPGEEREAQSRAQRIVELAAKLRPEALVAPRRLLESIPDVVAHAARAAMGEVLDDPDFLELLRFCDSLARIDTLLAGTSLVPRLANETTRMVEVALAPGRDEVAEFYLGDAFDADLATARGNYAHAQAELDAAHSRARDELARALGREEISGDEFIVMRSDLPGALPAGVRVVREAATYFLCALEYGETALAALERRDAAAGAVAELEERVRARLSAIAGKSASGIRAAGAAVAELDVALGAARFSQQYGCTAPEVTQEPELAFTSGRFLPLEAELELAGRRFVPIDLDLRGVAVLTGPNMGGKSVSLQICGFLALATAFGLPVPAAAARIGLFEQIAWLGLGRDERAAGLLSSFAQELLSLKGILGTPASRVLICVDEFARTTTPREGKALVLALIERLRQRCACGLIATHLHGIAAEGGVPHFAVRGLKELPAVPATHDLGEALVTLAASMDYTIVEVDGQESARADAVALAELLGVDRDFIEAAYRALSQ
jgi:DNA mismatch repair ATPase MutS